MGYSLTMINAAFNHELTIENVKAQKKPPRRPFLHSASYAIQKLLHRV